MLGETGSKDLVVRFAESNIVASYTFNTTFDEILKLHGSAWE